MKPSFCWRLLVLLAASLLAFGPAGALAKDIHLRNQLIQPPAKSSQPRIASAAPTPRSGLYLVQFTRPLTPQDRTRLSSLGVSLLRYVPEDAFIARLRNTDTETLRTMDIVEWVGEYKPEYKLHEALTRSPAGGNLKTVQSAQPTAVSVLLARDVSPEEIASARLLLTDIQQEASLRAGTVLRGRVTSAQLSALASSGVVLWVEQAPVMKLVDEVSAKIISGDGGENKLLTQAEGYDGSGVVVAVADSGLDVGESAGMHPDLAGRTDAFFYYGNLDSAADEHSHGTHVAGIIAGNGATGEKDENGALYGLGVAPGAHIIAQRIFDGVGGYEAPPSYERLTRDATRAGAVIGSNSWGDDTQGRYDISAMEFDELVRDADALRTGNQQYIMEFSAGNAGSGPQTIGSPAVGKNVLATGASQNDRLDFLIYADGIEAMADFSSRGPCEDGRIKPDLVAPGTWISSLQSSAASDQFAWAAIDNYYQYQGGTSQAGPHASGAAAVFVQLYRETHNNQTPSPALVKAALINSARDLGPDSGVGPVPNNDEGWGIIDLPAFFDPTLGFDYLDQEVRLTNSQVYERSVLLSASDAPLKITLAYTDVPGFPGAIPALVNDLDLELIGPDGTVYRGNQFAAGVSVANPAGRDSINNVEGIYLESPVPGEYRIRVRGKNIVQDALDDTAAVDQDFALVVSGALTHPGQGSVAMDRSSYTAPSTIRLTLLDTDLAGQTTATVSLASTTEGAGEAVVLRSSGGRGVFTGAVATATGPAIADGKLQIAHNDTITARYFDASSGSTRTASAGADLVAPVLTEVSAANTFGHVAVTWSSDEPATSLVLFGTNASPSSLTGAVQDTELTTSHEVNLSGLVQGTTYYYAVASSDEAGNWSTNSNGGTLFSFTVAARPAVLLVDEYQDALVDVPPLAGYTEPLDQVGVPYDVWDGVNLGPPDSTTLSGYRAVIYRVPELGGAWGPEERAAISNYVSSGGSVFVASMELLSRLTEANATDFIHNVFHVSDFLTDETGSSGASQVVGVAGDSLAGGFAATLDYTPYEEAWAFLIEFGGLPSADLSDTIVAGTNATTILRNQSDEAVGLKWSGTNAQSGRLVYLSFPFDAVPMSGAPNDRVHLLRNILSFLIPDLPGLGSIALSSPAYNLPSKVDVQLGYGSAAGAGSVVVKASTDTDSAGINVVLTETTRKGVFEGSFTLLPATNSSVVPALTAKNGDTLRVSFSRPAPNEPLAAVAVIDTLKPTISNVDAEPDYIEAVVSWETDEPADSLVQFGESPLLGRTAYDPNPTTVHALTLPVLAPDKAYYYQVVSRDPAGNTSTDDNHGALYTLRTLPPLLPPWFDDLEAGATNWSTVTSDSSQLSWLLGRPDNGGVSAAHSGVNAWGSNLKGEPSDFAECFLISPAIYLTNGNSATLTFWNWYDFTAASESGFDIEMATLEIVANNAAPVQIAEFSDASGDWVQEQIDLTPYAGKVIYVVWHYLLFSMDSLPRPGWLVDDVGITVKTVQPGTVEISNNIPEASFVLSGPMFVKGKGTHALYTNAPPGEYILEFADVANFVTPAAQTNTLTPGATLYFVGNYTAQTSTDSDGDGVSDADEAVAGTDPNNPASVLTVQAAAQPDHSLKLKWTGAVGRNYRILGSSDAVHWTPATDWLSSASTNTMSATVSQPSLDSAYMFRLEVAKP